MKNSFPFWFGCVILWTLTSCSLPQAVTETALPNSTSIYSTVSAQLTATRQIATIEKPALTPSATPQQTISPLPVVTFTPVFTQTPSSTFTEVQTARPKPSATAPAVPCDLAAPGRPYVDISIPDGAHLKAGQTFSKTWRLVNAGSCVWTKDYAIVWFSGEVFGAVREQLMGTTVPPGQSIDITVDMIAPRSAGPHQSNWKLRNTRNALFGIGPTGDAPFWVQIEVDEAATPTATSQPSPTVIPTLTTLVKGAQELVVGGSAFDLDTGKSASGPGDDISLQKADGGGFVLAPINNARLAEMSMPVPGDLDCRTANLTTAPIPAVNLKEGATWCYRTSQGLPGYLRVHTAAKDLKVSLDYLTWAIP